MSEIKDNAVHNSDEAAKQSDPKSDHMKAVYRRLGFDVLMMQRDIDEFLEEERKQKV